ncbi:MAG: DUF397 domain-containing protein [Micromonosporaceae bacterium]
MAIPEEPTSAWRKSSRSGQTGACVEVAVTHDGILVRDSKDRDGPQLRFTRDEWAAFLDGVHGGEFTAD